MGMVDYVQHPQCMQEIAQGLDAKECLDYEKSEIERKMRKQLLPEFADEEDDEGDEGIQRREGIQWQRQGKRGRRRGRGEVPRRDARAARLVRCSARKRLL